MELTGEYHADCSMLLRELAFHKEQLDLYKKRVNERYEKIHELRAEVEALSKLLQQAVYHCESAGDDTLVSLINAALRGEGK